MMTVSLFTYGTLVKRLQSNPLVYVLVLIGSFSVQ